MTHQVSRVEARDRCFGWRVLVATALLAAVIAYAIAYIIHHPQQNGVEAPLPQTQIGKKPAATPVKCRGKEMPFREIGRVAYVHPDALMVYEPWDNASWRKKKFYLDKRFSFFKVECSKAYRRVDRLHGGGYRVLVPHNKRVNHITKGQGKKGVEDGIYKRVCVERFGRDLTPDGGQHHCK